MRENPLGIAVEGVEAINDASASGRAWPVMLPIVAGVGILTGLTMRLLFGWERPFWFDEVYTGIIAMQPTAGGYINDALHELSGPVFYGVMWAWEKVAGAGTAALRMPSALFSAAAPLIILWRGHPDPQVRLVWAALVALSAPAAFYSVDARPYSLLVLLTAAQAVLFNWLLRGPALPLAAGWALVSMLMILTHYYTLPLVAAQGLMYLIMWGRSAFRTWPAALAFLPLAMWMPIHLPFLFDFTAVAWQSRFGPRHFLNLPSDLLGIGWVSIPLVLVIAATVVPQLLRAARERGRLPYEPADVATFLSGVMAVGAIVAIALVSRTYVPRYLIPMIPPILFGVAVWAREIGRRWPAAPSFLLLLFVFLSPFHFYRSTADEAGDVRYQLEWEDASRAFAARGVRRLAFYWDERLNSKAIPAMLTRAGAFYLAREGYPITVVPLRPRDGMSEAEHRASIEAALAVPPASERDGFIWISGTPGILMDRMDHFRSRFDCRDYGTGRGFAVLGCIRR